MDKLEEQIRTIRIDAKERKIPIVRDVTASKLYSEVHKCKPKRILEIGTAVGYSTLIMKYAHYDAEIITIEKDTDRYQEAVNNIEDANVNGIKCVLGDAFDVLQELSKDGEKFDFIFLDGPKGYYYRYLQLIKQMLNINGCIFADNVAFFGMVASNIYPHRHKTIVVSLQKYLEEVSNPPYKTDTNLDIDDGYAITYYMGELK